MPQIPDDAERPLRVGDQLMIDGEPVQLMRRDLQCTRWLAETADGMHMILFTCERTKHMWITSDQETERLNESEG